MPRTASLPSSCLRARSRAVVDRARPLLEKPASPGAFHRDDVGHDRLRDLLRTLGPEVEAGRVVDPLTVAARSSPRRSPRLQPRSELSRPRRKRPPSGGSWTRTHYTLRTRKHKAPGSSCRLQGPCVRDSPIEVGEPMFLARPRPRPASFITLRRQGSSCAGRGMQQLPPGAPPRGWIGCSRRSS